MSLAAESEDDFKVASSAVLDQRVMSHSVGAAQVRLALAAVCKSSAELKPFC